MFYWERPQHRPAIEPVEVTARAAHDPAGVRTDVYAAGHEPAAWIWVDDAWHRACVRARHRYPDGAVNLQVLLTGDSPGGERTFRWGPGVLLAHPGHRMTGAAGVTGPRSRR
ncbi:hypothetical protein QOM21_32635 [Streptomyces sp. Pv4-95]|uniref:hypothetical protein n=1 Tax=Streptomyces sp. Pv4-95 TaxID=3049543 RepID=UPI0038913144